MKVLAFNGSPRKDKGNTAAILNPFLDGMRKSGADVELYYTKDLKINPCQGEVNCWLKTPGQCFQQDDMQMIYPKMQADLIVFASPVYVDGMTGSMKNLIDRLIPVVEPFIELRDGHCRHPLRTNAGTKPGKVVLVSVCGFWEMDNFEPLLIHTKAICRNLNREFSGALLRPCASVFRGMLARGAPVKDISEAIEESGRQLVVDGVISEDTLNTISREVMPREQFVEMVNHSFQQALDAVNK